ncbi:unnamed protein product, partial [Sphacelaria rigidula]
MKLEIGTTVAPARVFKGLKSSGQLLTAQPSSRGSTGNGDSRGAAMKRSCGSGITTGTNTKRLRRTAQLESGFDVTARDDVMIDEDGAGVKFELIVSASSDQVSSFSARERRNLLTGTVHALFRGALHATRSRFTFHVNS